MMKRRNVDCVKPRRPLKRNKISEGIYGSSVIYIKFVLIWLVVLSADYLLDFRFEYLWPFWLLLRSVYDSFRYQGLAFCVLFVCMAVTADMVAIVFIPASWLFFAASTYVWVQFVWHTEKGVCMPTIVLWAVFIYIEAMVRLKEVKNVPFHMDLCRPFAAHCIGYPVVTLGFGLKSYVGYRLRQRRQREVARENEFYVQLLQEALPPDLQHIKNADQAGIKSYEETPVAEVEANGTAQPTAPAAGVASSSNSRATPATSSSCISRGSEQWWWGASKENFLASLISRLINKNPHQPASSVSTQQHTPTQPPSSSSSKSNTSTAASTSTYFTSWWRGWISKPDTVYNNKNVSSHNLPSSTGGSSSSSSSSSCSSASSSSSSSGGTASSSKGRGSGVKGGGDGKDTSPSVGAVSTPNGSVVHHQLTASVSVPPSTAPPNNKHNNKLNSNSAAALHAAELEYMQKKGISPRSVNNFDEATAERDKTLKNTNTSTASSDVDRHKNKCSQQSNGSAKLTPVAHNTNNLRDSSGSGVTSTGGNNKKNKNKDNRDSSTPARDDALTIVKLESDLKRARVELNSSRHSEQELRNQINSMLSEQKECQQELSQLQHDNETLQNKLHGLVSARQSDRLSYERRLTEERRIRTATEAQLQQTERRARKLEEQRQQQQNKTNSAANISASASSGECSEACRSRRAELEAELKRLRRDNRAQEERIRACERENLALRQYKESQSDNEVLMSALTAMQERNNHLETKLSEETRVKLDLFSALGEAKRQLQIDQNALDRKEKEIEELKAKITEVLAVCPATSFSSNASSSLQQAPLHNSNSGGLGQQSYQYSSKLLLPQVSSALDASIAHTLVGDHLNLDSLVVGLGFPTSSLAPQPPPPLSPPVQLSNPQANQSQQQPPISPPTPVNPISPPNSSTGGPQHSSLDPNARIYTPKCVSGSSGGAQDN